MKATKNSLTRMRAQNLRKHETSRRDPHFVFFEDECTVSCNGPTLIVAPHKGGRELKGKALLVNDARKLARDLPKGRLGKQVEFSLEKDELAVKDATGRTHKAPLSDRKAPDWRSKLPRHDDYYEAAVNPRELRAAVMSVEQLEADRNLFGKHEPSVTLRLSKNPDHPIEICGKHGVFAAVAPQERSFIAHVFGRISKWFKAIANDTTTSTAKPEVKELAKAA